MYIEQHSRYQNKANNIQLRYDDKQFHTTVIKDVLLWIEHNLDQSLLLDDVANKAGYTKWYFQRLFKKVTGVTLARLYSCSSFDESGCWVEVDEKNYPWDRIKISIWFPTIFYTSI